MHNPMAALAPPESEFGWCDKHDCALTRIEYTVPSFAMSDKYRTGEQHEHQPIFCKACEAEKKAKKLAELGCLTSVEGASAKKESAVGKLLKTKGIDITRDVIVRYTYEDELSVVGAQNFVRFLEKDIGKEKRVKVIDTTRFVELRQSRFMSDEKKAQYLKVTHEAETCDILVINTLADYGDNSEEDINNLMLGTRDGCAIVILTIPESADRLEFLPTKLKFRMKRAQEMNISSRGGQVGS